MGTDHHMVIVFNEANGIYETKRLGCNNSFAVCTDMQSYTPSPRLVSLAQHFAFFLISQICQTFFHQFS